MSLVLRLLCAGTLVVCAYLIGLSFSAEEKKKLAALEAMRRLLEYMRLRITVTRTPLNELFRSYNDVFLEKHGFLQALRAGTRDIPCRFSEACALLPLREDALSELTVLGRGLGTLPLCEQEKQLAVCMSALEAQSAEMRQKLPARTKSIKTVSVLFGLLAAIILI